MGDIQLDAKTFHRRAKHLFSTWKASGGDDDAFAGADSLLVVLGSSNEENPYQKSSSLHTWMLGYEFPAMLMLFSKEDEKITFLTSASKAKLLDGLEKANDKVDMEILRRTKDDAHNEGLFKQIVEQIPKIGKKVGIFAKDTLQGKFVTEWQKVYNPKDLDVDEVDVSAGMASVVAVKDEQELKAIRAASKSSVVVMTKYFVDEMSTIIDEERKVSHMKLAEQVERVVENEKFVKGKLANVASDFDGDQLEWCYTPIIQSGGNYSLKPSAQSDEKNLHGGVIVASLGLRYKSYCSNVGRTYLIDPNDKQEKYYAFLLNLQKKILESIKQGAVIKDIYNKALGLIKSKAPELEPHFPKNIGCGIGIEFRDTSLLLNGKNNRTLKDGMTLNLSIGFENLENKASKDPKGKVYSLLLIDTVRVTTEAPVVLTDSPKSQSDVSFYFKDEGSEEEVKPEVEKPRRAAAAAIMSTKTRGENRVVDDNSEVKRKSHQKDLQEKKQQEGMERFAEGKEQGNGQEKAVAKKFDSYKGDRQMPPSVKKLQIVVDRRNHSIILPIYGRPVPFHINTLKNVSKNDEGDFVYLRLNFVSPGQGVGKKDDGTPFDDPNAQFVRSMTFRSKDTAHMAEIFKNIQDMKKEISKKEAERKEMADVVEQASLIEIRNRRPLRLGDVFVRPGLEGKRVPGEIEIHQNGIRYQSPLRSDHRIDILFTNIKHLFFQPCDNELIVIIHVHLKNPIIIGKKKQKDVQFYREASDVQFDETGNRKRKYRYGDEDELEAEQEERRRRAQLNKEFRGFAEKIAESSDGRVDVDIPFRELGFQGVPSRSAVLLQPTTECLVHLSDPPFLVVTLEDIEIAHLERVQFGLKNFDMVLVFKDFHRAPVHINTIPVSQLDNVKEWLDSVDIAFSEGPLNLNWSTIMKTVNDDPKQFFEDGGWSFLQLESDAEQSDDEDAESEFEGSEGEEEDDESDVESGYDEDASDDEGSEMSEDEESGEDWDELERKAKRADDEKRRGGREDEDERPVKRRK
ncbi:FACT complex subunit spt16 [Saitoella coloradoensis]